MSMQRRVFLAVICAFGVSQAAISTQAAEVKGASKYAIVVHGGAGNSPAELSRKDRKAKEASMAAATRAGQKILASGGTALDAVETVIRNLEDDPLFNSGKGSVFNAAGINELDSSIMDGQTMACGAVAGVRTVRHPISAARHVMTDTRHVLLAGGGADRFAADVGLEIVEPKYFWTQGSWDELQGILQKEKSEAAERKKHMGTVGCAALDTHGNMAAGTSTGGLVNKKNGRVGDSPIIGAGTYANNATCAVSCTGVGEDFIRYAIAYDISAQMAYKGISVAEAVRNKIHHPKKIIYGGIIAVDYEGNVSVEFNTPGMSRAIADSSGRFEVKLGK